MANQTFITRIKQKFDTYSNWSSESAGNLVLLKGEMAVSYLQATGSDRSLDKYFIKIGDGATSYKNLPYISTVDSIDVPNWAKQDELPVTTTGTGTVVSGATFTSWVDGTETKYGIQLTLTNDLNVDSVQAYSLTIPSDTSIDDGVVSIDGNGLRYTQGLDTALELGVRGIRVNGSSGLMVSVSDTMITGYGFGNPSAVNYIQPGLIRPVAVLTSTTTILNTNDKLKRQLVDKDYVDTEIQKVVSGAVEFMGATATLPSDTGMVNGYMYKASATFTIPAEKNAEGTGEVEVQVGDTIIADVSGTPAVVKWWYIETQADTDTWRPIQIINTSIGSNTLRFSSGCHTSINPTTLGNTTTIKFDHNTPGTTTDVAGSSNKLLTTFGYDIYGHYSGTFSNVIPANGSHTTVSMDSTALKWDHNAVGETSATYSATSGYYISGIEYDAYGHISGITQDILPRAPQISVTYTGSNISVSKSTSGNISTFTVSHISGTSSQIIASLPGQYISDVSLDSNGHIVSASENYLPVASLTIVATGGENIGIVPLSASGTPGTPVYIYTLGAYDPTENRVVLEQDIAAFATKTYVDSTVSAAINALDASITANGSATTSQVSVFTKINEVDGKLTSTNSQSVLLATVASTGKIDDLTQTNYVIFDCGDSTTTI